MIQFKIQLNFQGHVIGTTKDVIDFIDRKFDNKKIIEKFAEGVRLHLEENIVDRVDMYGIPIESYAPMAPSTIAKKKKEGKPLILFYNEGFLRQSVKMTDIASGYVIFIGDARRVKVAVYLNNGTNRMPTRQFWGIIPPKAEEVLREAQRLAA